MTPSQARLNKSSVTSKPVSLSQVKAGIKKAQASVPNVPSSPSPIASHFASSNNGPCLPPGAHRRGDILETVFPLPVPLCCTEDNCNFSSAGKTWNSVKGSLVRHLMTTHQIIKLKYRNTCSLCSSSIKLPKEHPCLAQGLTTNSSISSQFNCSFFSFAATSALGLKNHEQAHRKIVAADNAPKIQIPRRGPKKWKKRRGKDVIDVNAPDEAISDPNQSIAELPSSSSPSPPVMPSDPEQVPGPLDIYTSQLESILLSDQSDDNFARFCELMDQAIAETRQLSFLPVKSALASLMQLHVRLKVLLVTTWVRISMTLKHVKVYILKITVGLSGPLQKVNKKDVRLIPTRYSNINKENAKS